MNELSFNFNRLALDEYIAYYKKITLGKEPNLNQQELFLNDFLCDVEYLHYKQGFSIKQAVEKVFNNINK